MNVLGVQFDSKLSWFGQINKTINKSKKSLHALNLIRKYFSKTEMKGLLTSNFYSILYCNSEIRHLPTLAPQLKQILLAASANALKLCTSKLPLNNSYTAIHNVAKRATPTQMSKYKHAAAGCPCLERGVSSCAVQKLRGSVLCLAEGVGKAGRWLRACVVCVVRGWVRVRVGWLVRPWWRPPARLEWSK